MKAVSLGDKKKTYRSMKAAADEHGIKYITLVMRLRMGMTLAQAVRCPVRPYKKKA